MWLRTTRSEVRVLSGSPFVSRSAELGRRMNNSRVQRRKIGSSDLEVGVVGVGTWQWGGGAIWASPKGPDQTDIPSAYDVALDHGLDFLDTAEIYGAAESVIGGLRSGDARPAVIASKYFPNPKRWRLQALDRAIDRSLERLGVDCIDLYQVHWPFSMIPHRRLLRRLAAAVHDGRIRYVGVSNFTAVQTRRAYAILADAGVPLVSNQVSYSLLRRAPEVNGVLDACRELEMTLIGYSPLAQGLLAGKFRLGVQGVRTGVMSALLGRPTPDRASAVNQSLLRIGAEIGASQAQVAIAWMCRDPAVLPIVGVRNAAHAKSNVDAAAIQLDSDQLHELDAVSVPFRRVRWATRRLVG